MLAVCIVFIAGAAAMKMLMMVVVVNIRHNGDCLRPLADRVVFQILVMVTLCRVLFDRFQLMVMLVGMSHELVIMTLQVSILFVRVVMLYRRAAFTHHHLGLLVAVVGRVEAVEAGHDAWQKFGRWEDTFDRVERQHHDQKRDQHEVNGGGGGGEAQVGTGSIITVTSTIARQR